MLCVRVPRRSEGLWQKVVGKQVSFPQGRARGAVSGRGGWVSGREDRTQR